MPYVIKVYILLWLFVVLMLCCPFFLTLLLAYSINLTPNSVSWHIIFKWKIGKRAIFCYFDITMFAVASCLHLGPAQLLRLPILIPIPQNSTVHKLLTNFVRITKTNGKKPNWIENQEKQVRKNWRWKQECWTKKNQMLSEIDRSNQAYWALVQNAMSLKSAAIFTLNAKDCVCWFFSQFHFLFTFIQFYWQKIQMKQQKIKSILLNIHTHRRARACVREAKQSVWRYTVARRNMFFFPL